MKSDIEIRNDVQQELAWEPAVNETDIGVEVRDGIVVLSGHLRSYTEKVAAERAVQRVAGVKGLALDLQVKLPGDAFQDDAELASAARMVLDWDNSLAHCRIDIRVEDGVVTLSGTVHAEYQRQAAERDVRNLRGVTDIKNEIAVQAGVAPRDVKSKIEAALQRRAHEEVKGIAVEVDADQVTLSGSVPSWTDRNLIIYAARNTPGVSNVVDKIAITP